MVKGFYGFAAASAAVLFLGALASCENPADIPADILIAAQISLDTAVIDFGLVEAGAGSEVRAATVTNTGETAVTISSVELSDSLNYRLTVPETPFTLEPGASQEISAAFAPAVSGTLNATVSVAVEGLADPVSLNLTGSGNFRPGFGAGMAAFDPNAAVAGFYAQAGTVNGLPAYKRVKLPPDQTDLFLYLYDSVNADPEITASIAAAPYTQWRIADAVKESQYGQLGTVHYSETNTAAQTPDQVQTWDSNESDLTISALSKPFVSGFYSYTGYDQNQDPYLLIYEGDTVYVYYLFKDKDGDAEGASVFQWYLCTAPESEGTAISGANSYSFQIPAGQGYAGKYLKAEVRPVAAGGFAEGAPVKSAATPVIETMPS